MAPERDGEVEIVAYVLLTGVVAIFALQLFVYIKSRAMKGRPAPEMEGAGQRSERRSLYYFYSPSCHACRNMGPVVDGLAQRYSGVEKVDVTQRLEVARRFGVRATPTTVLVSDGAIEDVLLGAQREDRLRQFLEAGPPLQAVSGGQAMAGGASSEASRAGQPG